MAGIFTRTEVAKILNNADLTPEQRADEIFSLYGRAIDDGFVTKKAAETAQNAAIEAAKTEWEKAQTKPDPTQSAEYAELKGQFDAYKAKEAARNSDDYKGVKAKFFDEVYSRIDRSEGAKPVPEQIADMKKSFEEFFVPAENPTPTPAIKFPQFGGQPAGGMPSGAEGATAAFAGAWGFNPKK